MDIFPVAEDSGNIDEEINACIGDILNGGDGVGDGVFGFNIKLEDIYT